MSTISSSMSVGASWLESTARERLTGLLDPDSFNEFVGPWEREASPHLARFNLPASFDDGIVVGSASLNGQPIWIAAQEGRFMGGTFSEVAGAKLVGLLRVARAFAQQGKPRAVLLLLDSGGVRLQEANAGELAVSEVIRALLQARSTGLRVIALIGGTAGAFGGGGIVTACCSDIVVSEHARIGVTGPEVIEINKGVEEFDSKDRALVWRITGARTRVLTGGADRYVKDDMEAFRRVAIELLTHPASLDLELLKGEQRRLKNRLDDFRDCEDALDILRKRGWNHPERMFEIDDEQFLCELKKIGEESHVAR
ncbi:biotin-independent malonate decarboxylase subunit beta [Paraburkholderia humisilvae]|uniref:Malonyl-S-ACP:biotin-protein carboxyltransferase MADC n=1 Tax=Paraburkholderia humisilvae TaxID=627669 RepID=A0A6J5F4A9_9BURK|nr:biotin-independent malonate decarboxylase subunit beta [Paraburkholderia humisilvae]CAB3773183.1 Malonyl-S-ACP:biotin-protein carboxyltransferase MADC [Paraburkholderia humisilvae]